MQKNKIKVLISPKNLDEARVITKVKNVDFLDCKNPEEGSLGANFPWVIKQMKALIKNSKTYRLSAAIGDFPFLPGSASLAALGAAVSGADIIKVGLKGPKNVEEGTKLMKNVVKAVEGYRPAIKVVSAGYADHSRIEGSPNFMDIPEIAFNSGADIAMLDTCIKDGKGLFDFLSIEKLVKFKNKADSLNLMTALAGSLRLEDLPKIKKISPDIIGIRSVVCEGFDRNKGSIKLELIERFMNELIK